jgi:hypothetical protein
MPSNFRPTITPTDILVDAAVVYIGTASIGVLRGDPTFDPGREIRNAAEGMNGARTKIKGLDRTIRWNSVISGVLLEFGASATPGGGNTLRYLEPGSTETTPSSIVTITPNPGGEFLASGDYVTDLKFIKKRGNATFWSVRFPSALCVTWSLAGGENDEGLVNFTFEARKTVSALSDLEAAPYVIERLSALPT